jgi:hypothetical protein
LKHSRPSGWSFRTGVFAEASFYIKLVMQFLLRVDGLPVASRAARLLLQILPSGIPLMPMTDAVTPTNYFARIGIPRWKRVLKQVLFLV